MKIDDVIDAMLDRPPTPYFIPGKTGLDKETQIYDGDVGLQCYFIYNSSI